MRVHVPVSPVTRVVYLFLLMLAGLFVAGLFLTVLMLIPGLEAGSRAAIYTGTVLQSVLAFILPAYLVVRMGGGVPSTYFMLKNESGMGRKATLGVLAFLFSYLFVSFLNQWNKGIVLPESLQGVERWMRSLEDAAMETTHLLLSGGNAWHFILNLLIVAGLAALAEEIFFRGALQQFIQEKTANGHAAVWVTALIFSVVHFQFYGFFPRFVLGALLGYLFLYTHNLWVPILVHFINNASVIVLSYFWGESEWMKNLEEVEVAPPFAIAASLSALLTLLLFIRYRKKSSYSTIQQKH